MENAAERALGSHLAGGAKFGVSQVLHADPGGRAEQNNNEAAEPVAVHALREGKHGRHAADAIEEQSDFARAQAAVEEPVVDMVAIGSKQGLVTQEAASDRQTR